MLLLPLFLMDEGEIAPVVMVLDNRVNDIMTHVAFFGVGFVVFYHSFPFQQSCKEVLCEKHD